MDPVLFRLNYYVCTFVSCVIFLFFLIDKKVESQDDHLPTI